MDKERSRVQQEMDRRDRDYAKSRDRIKEDELEKRRVDQKDIERRRGREPIEERDVRETEEERRRSFEDERESSKYDRKSSSRPVDKRRTESHRTESYRTEPAGSADGVIKVVDQPRHKVQLRLGKDVNPLVELIRNLAAGKLPSNAIVNEALEQTQNGLGVHIRESGYTPGSKEKKITEDAVTFISDIQRLFNEKNADEKFQTFLEEVALAAKETVPAATSATTDKLKKQGAPLAEDFKRFFYEFRHSVYSIATDAEFRNFLVELLDFFKLLFSRAADSAQGKTFAQPSTATFVPAPPPPPPTTTGRTGEWVKVPIGSNPIYGQTYKQGQAIDQTGAPLPTGIPVTGMTVTPTTTAPAPLPVEGEQSARWQSFQGASYPPPSQTVAYAPLQSGSATTSGRDLGKALREDIMSGNNSMKGARDTASQMAKSVLTDLKSGNLWADSEERRRLAERWRSLMIRCTENSSFKNAMRELLRLWDHLFKLSTDLSKGVSGTSSVHATRALDELKAIIESFTRRSLNPLLDEISELRRDVQKDQETTYLLREWRTQLEKTLDRPELLKEDKHFNKFEELMNRTRTAVSRDTYNKRLRFIIDELSANFNGFTKDKTLTRLFDDWKILMRDLFLQDSGKFSPWALRDSFNTFRRAFIPVLLHNVDFIPIPKIEGSTDKFTYALDHVWFSLRDVLPDRIHFGFDTDTDFAVRELTPDVFRARFSFLIRDIETHLKDVWFYFRKFKGMKWEDHGIMDIDIDGMTVNFDYAMTHMADGRWSFSVRDANCTIRRMRIRFKKAQHRFLDNFATGVFGGMIKKRIEKAIREQMWAKGDTLNEKLNYFFNERPLIMKEKKLARKRYETEHPKEKVGLMKRARSSLEKRKTKKKTYKTSKTEQAFVDRAPVSERREREVFETREELAPERVGPFGNIKETYPADTVVTREYVEKYVPPSDRKSSLKKIAETEDPLERKYRPARPYESSGRNVEASA